MTISFHANQSDLRTRKIDQSLCNAMSTLLNQTNFKKLTVLSICEEAQIGRAAFYSRFTDKYSLLKDWLVGLVPSISLDCCNDELEQHTSLFLTKNKRIIKNILDDADDETSDIISYVILTTLRLDDDTFQSAKNNTKCTMLIRFLTGGLMSYLNWQVVHDFPAEVKNANQHIFDFIRQLRHWITSEITKTNSNKP